MNKSLSIALLMTLSLLGGCSTSTQLEQKSTSSNSLKINIKKFCYYEGVEFSKGSIVKQIETLKVCERDNSGVLFWKATS